MKVGWNLHGDAKQLRLTKDGKELKFTHTVKTQKVMLFVIRIKRSSPTELANPSIDATRKKYKKVKRTYLKSKQKYKRAKKLRKQSKDKSTKQKKTNVHKK